MQLPTFTAAQATEYRSLTAGIAFGRLYCTANYRLSPAQIAKVVRTLKPYSKFNAYWYKYGFVYGYRMQREKFSTVVTQLPVGLTDKERDAIVKISTIRQQVKDENPFNGYLKPADVVKSKVTFCIRRVEIRNSKDYGEQWVLHCVFPEGFLEQFKAEEGRRTANVTLSRNSNGNATSKDKTLMKIYLKHMEQQNADEEPDPCHLVVLKSIPLGGKKSFMDLESAEGPDGYDADGHELCVCGEVVEEETEEEEDTALGELDDSIL